MSVSQEMMKFGLFKLDRRFGDDFAFLKGKLMYIKFHCPQS